MDPKTKELRLFLCAELQAATNEWAIRKTIRNRKSILRRESEARLDRAQRMLDELDRLIGHATADEDVCTECGLNPAAHALDPERRLCDGCFADLYGESADYVGDPVFDRSVAGDR